MTNLLRRLWCKLLMRFCTHPTVYMKPKAHHKVNHNNKIRIECAICRKVFYKLGKDLDYEKPDECVCICKKGQK